MTGDAALSFLRLGYQHFRRNTQSGVQFSNPTKGFLNHCYRWLIGIVVEFIFGYIVCIVLTLVESNDLIGIAIQIGGLTAAGLAYV